ncbi:MAG: hypothetical protein KA275_01830 [Chitinophagaceae bacterium]|nr:hypothetical protein [Chitinophagaceae bacterium]
MRLFTTIFLFIILIFSCEKKKINTPKIEAYYKFEASDESMLLNYTPNQLILFKNEIGTELYFQYIKSEFDLKQLYGAGWGFFGGKGGYFYYDTKTIWYRTLPDSNVFIINFTKWPLDIESAKSDKYFQFPSELEIHISYFPFWNETSNSIGVTGYNLTSLTINGVFYTNVKKMISTNNVISVGMKNVNVIYYKDNIGIIGFDDLENHKWRIQL